MEAELESRVLEYIRSFERENDRVPYLAEVAEGLQCCPEDVRETVNSLHTKGEITPEERLDIGIDVHLT